MTIVNMYEAKTNLSRLAARVQAGEQITIAKNGTPIIDLKPYKPAKQKIKYGFLTGKIEYKDEDLVGIDPEIQEMFYGKDWDK